MLVEYDHSIQTDSEQLAPLPGQPLQQHAGRSGTGLFRSTFIITFFSVLKLALTFALQMALAAKFGAQIEMDAYLAASTIPTLVTTVLLTTLNMTFVPVFVEYKVKKSEREAWQVTSTFFNLAFIVLGIISLAGVLGASWIIRLTVPGFNVEGETFSLTVHLLQVLFPSVLFGGLTGVLSSVYYAERKFTSPSNALMLNSLIVLLVTFGLSAKIGIMSVAVGTLVGSVVQLGLLLPLLFHKGRFSLEFNLRHPGVIKITKLMLPLVVSALFYRANTVVDRFIASGLAEGSISQLGYAFKVVSVLSTLVTQGFTLALLPLMSEHAAANDMEGLRSTISMGTRLMIFVVTPMVVALGILRIPMVQLLFERGAFDREATMRTAQALLCYLGWMYAGGVGIVVVNAFYALQATHVVVKVGIIGMLLEIVLAIILTKLFDFAGLALALSFVAVINALLFWILLSRKLQALDGKHIFQTQLKVLFASLVMAGVLLTGVHLVQVTGNSLQNPGLLLLVVSIPTMIAATFYILVTRLLRCEEALSLSRWIGKLRVGLAGEIP
jgi:putative peptidoglycan lipid II flippase